MAMSACQVDDTCSLQSNIDGFQPICEEAAFARYTDETRVAIPGDAGMLVLSLPPDLEEEATYGGTTGNPLYVTLELLDEDSAIVAHAPESRTSTIVIGAIDSESILIRCNLDFSFGEITG